MAETSSSHETHFPFLWGTQPDYISQSPLQLSMTMKLFWPTTSAEVMSALVHKSLQCHSSLSLSSSSDQLDVNLQGNLGNK